MSWPASFPILYSVLARRNIQLSSYPLQPGNAHVFSMNSIVSSLLSHHSHTHALPHTGEGIILIPPPFQVSGWMHGNSENNIKTINQSRHVVSLSYNNFIIITAYFVRSSSHTSYQKHTHANHSVLTLDRQD